MQNKAGPDLSNSSRRLVNLFFSLNLEAMSEICHAHIHRIRVKARARDHSTPKSISHASQIYAAVIAWRTR